MSNTDAEFAARYGMTTVSYGELQKLRTKADNLSRLLAAVKASQKARNDYGMPELSHPAEDELDAAIDAADTVSL